MSPLSIVWLRQDLRLHDHAALFAAAQEGRVVPVYILDDETPGRWKIGEAQRWWLHHSLASLSQSLERLGSSLVLRRCEVVQGLVRLAAELGTRRIHATQHYEPWWRLAEKEVATQLDLVLHEGNVLAPPEYIKTAAGGSFRIFTPYRRALQEHLPPGLPLPSPETLQAPEPWPDSEDLHAWGLLPTGPAWAAGFSKEWSPGEAAALERLGSFRDQAWYYSDRRDLPGRDGTSRLSPHLHFGELSARLIWHTLPEAAGEKFRKELAWRDFSHNVMLTQPAVGERAGRLGLEAFPWRSGPEADADFRAWSVGRTGFPIVDAGMRQLWATGWMHNRVRMIAASFLVKHLLIDWRQGADWFWDTLVDADYGNNSQNWQWIAGTSVDSQPFGRIMAPILQSAKFDAADYIRRWVPELHAMSDDQIHDPGLWRPAEYPQPIVGHGDGRQRALAAFTEFRNKAASSRA